MFDIVLLEVPFFVGGGHFPILQDFEASQHKQTFFTSGVLVYMLWYYLHSFFIFLVIF